MRKAEGNAHTAKANSVPIGTTKKPMPEDNRAWVVVGRWSGWRWQGSSGREATAMSCLRHPKYLSGMIQRCRLKERSCASNWLRNNCSIHQECFS